MNHLSNWIEIPVTNLKRAQKFYEAVLKVELAPMQLGAIRYALFPTEDRFNSGALAEGEGYKPSENGVTVYLDGGKEMDALLTRAASAGGTVLLSKTFLSVEAGYLGLFLDTEGNKMGVQSMD